MSKYLAIDIGASSGRHILGWMENGSLCTREVYRFHNGVQDVNGHLVWDIAALEKSVLEGLKIAFEAEKDIDSVSVDTWGVDYVLLDKDDKIISPVYAYRDHRTEAAVEKVHSKVPFETLYSHTGCQFQNFNTIYQLWDDLEKGRLDKAQSLLMIPEYLLYTLCGIKSREYTNATTTGLIDAKTGQYDREIIKALGYPEHLFPALQQPGVCLGQLKEDVAQYVGGQCRVVLCATHDTGSAVEGIPMTESAPYISSGTWSLLGVKTPAPITTQGSRLANYSNEGGVGYNRYQKNIMGMWLVNRLRDELCPDMPFDRIVQAARESDCTVLVDANSPAFLSPSSMVDAFRQAAGESLKTVGDYFCCAYRSLAVSYREALQELESNTGSTYNRLYIVGGGAKNAYLNHLTQEATGKEVVALPIEATALGNLKIQMEAVL